MSQKTPGVVAPAAAVANVDNGHGLQQEQKVLVLFLGGQLGQEMHETGIKIAPPGYFTEQIMRLVQLNESNGSFPNVDVKELESLDSWDVQPSHWALLAEEIYKAYHSYDGFVVVMGTDTMAYTASALSFMLENLGKAVIFTGAQVRFGDAFSDAKRNLLVSMAVAPSLDIPEVCIFFDDALFRGNRARKADSGAFHAFGSPNFPPLARLGLQMEVNRAMVLLPPKGKFRIHTKMDEKVVVLKMAPYFDVSALKQFSAQGTKSCRALILELYGTGNAPHRISGFLEALKQAKDNGLLVVVTSQCAAGSVVPGSYAVNKDLEEIGVIPAIDMTTEATCAKIVYLYGKGLTSEQVQRSMGQSLRGEISKIPQSQVSSHLASRL